jgi:hypothetical protein
VLADAVQERIGSPVPPPGIPGPFGLGVDGVLETTLAAAGLEQVRVQEVGVPTHDAHFDAYWKLRTDLAGPLKKLLDTLSAQDLASIRQTVLAGLSRYQTTDGLRIPGLAYIGSARRPGAADQASRDG